MNEYSMENWNISVVPIKKQFPEAYKADQQTLKGDRTKLGAYSIGKHKLQNDKELLIFNVYGQYTYGTKKVELQYTALKKAFENISLKYPNIKIGFPYKIGCDRAGGDWNIVSKMIEEYFPNHTIVKLPNIK